MKKALRVLGFVFAVLALFGVGSYFYIFRQQEIAVRLIPNDFEYCGSKIWGDDEQYQEIVSWLKQNKNGWVLSYATYVPGQVYRHPAFKVNVLDGVVVVSYKNDYGYPQYVKTINHGLDWRVLQQLTSSASKGPSGPDALRAPLRRSLNYYELLSALQEA